MTFLQKPDQGVNGRRRVDPAAVDALAVRWPALAEYLSGVVWEDGSPRETSTLLLLWEDSVWKCCLNDRDGQRCLWHSSVSLEALLDGLEVTLEQGGGDWRRRPPGRRKNS